MRNADPRGVRFASCRAVAPPLFADDEQQRYAALAARAQPLRSGYLRGKNAFRIARPPAVEPPVAHAAWNKRRDAVVVGREHDGGRVVEVREHD